ncbi:2OG-Fe(II) oxygenase [Thiohalobacter sp.]|uniref:2OG-Fe(II) oxygenase n=1 Tax=Thiohalobacter sp. TaxID=2025948 RepID=UPI00262B924C|nr:2OG-Fe(II) oxygenase [Thiohalobacter sp.]
MLSNEVLSSREDLKEKLKGPVVVLEDALDAEVAKELQSELLKSGEWVREDGSTWGKLGYQPGRFEVTRDSINIASEDAPAALKSLFRYLMAPETREWFSYASGQKLDRFIGSAAVFHQGDGISEHNDDHVFTDGENVYRRALTFNYYLSTDWEAAWGGNLVWKSPRMVITPSFNKLVLFNVRPSSHHWVEAVRCETPHKRLSITGWYLTKIEKENFSLDI